MIHYKGFTAWLDCITNEWHLMEGYKVLKSYATLQGCKCAITIKWSKGRY